jgi:hypothetical protein
VVGAKGFEPSTSWSRTRRASQAALRPESYSMLPNSLRGIASICNHSSISKNKAAGKLLPPGGIRKECETALELVAQRKLHHARVGEQAGVVAKSV